MNQTQSNNQNLIRFLYGKYRDRGLTVYSDFLSESSPVPEAWTGPHPDLIIAHRDHNTAICVETQDTLYDDDKLAKKWESILKNSNSKLRVVVREDLELKNVKRIAKLYKINAECIRVKRTPPEKRRVRVKVKSKRARKVDWVIVVTSLMILSVSLLLFGPTIIKLFKVEDYYRPFDKERQIQQLQKTINELGRK